VTATKGQRHQAILALVNRSGGGVHTQQELAEALARRGLRATQATIPRARGVSRPAVADVNKASAAGLCRRAFRQSWTK